MCFFRAARSSALHQEKPTHEDSSEIFLILVLHGHEPARLPPRHQWGENETVAPNASLDSGGRQHGPSNDVSRPMTPESRRRERDCWGPPGSSSRGCAMLAPSQCYPLKSWPQTPDLTHQCQRPRPRCPPRAPQLRAWARRSGATFRLLMAVPVSPTPSRLQHE